MVFSRESNSGEISFSQLETQRVTFVYSKVYRKIPNFKTQGALTHLLPLSIPHATELVSQSHYS